MMITKNSLKRVFILCLLVLSFLYNPTQAHANLSIVRDTEIENILHSWGEPIFEAAGLDPKAVNIILIESDSVNAFVAGGSNIFFYTGLISKTENPGELIGVLAHETGHIAGGHLIRTREALERASYESIIGTILGVGAAIASGDGSAVPAIALGSSSVAQRRFLAHSRIQESSADQAALTFLEQAEINPTGIHSFMDKLKAENYVPEDQQSEYVRTHPLIDNRIESMKTRIENSKHVNKPYPAQWYEDHARMTAKLIGFIHPGQIPWIYDDKDLSIPAEYARTIATYRAQKESEAMQRIDSLLTKEPYNPYFLELKGQMLVDFGHVKDSIPYYRKAIDQMADAPLFRIALAHALIESADDTEDRPLTEAVELLSRALQDEGRSTRIHRLLATAYGRLGEENQSTLHLAEEAVLQRRYEYARHYAQTVLQNADENSPLWIKAQDIVSFIANTKKE